MKFINPYRLFQGCVIPNWLLRRSELSASAKLAYGRIVQYAGKDGDAHPSYATLADELAVSPRQAIRLVQELCAVSLISVAMRERGDGGVTSNAYRFLDHAWMHEEDGDADGTTPMTQMTRPRMTPMSPKENHIEENHRNNKDLTFDQFYAKYPRRVARSAAERAWRKLSPNNDLLKQILSDIDRRMRVDWSQRPKELWPYPASYLNGQRWLDEPENPASYAHRNGRGEDYQEVIPPPFLEK